MYREIFNALPIQEARGHLYRAALRELLHGLRLFARIRIMLTYSSAATRMFTGRPTKELHGHSLEAWVEAVTCFTFTWFLQIQMLFTLPNQAPFSKPPMEEQPGVILP